MSARKRRVQSIIKAFEHRGHRRPALSNRRFVDPSVRRREQGNIDARRMLVAGGNPDTVAKLISDRGPW